MVGARWAGAPVYARRRVEPDEQTHREALDWTPGQTLGRMRQRVHEAIAYFSRPRATPSLPEPDPATLRRTIAIAGAICDVWFRAEVRHLERVPGEQTMLVGHHDGGLLPLDGLCLGVGWHRHFQFQRPLRVLMHELPFHISSGLTGWLHGIGIVSAAPSNLAAVLDRGDSVLIYPGAAREAFRPYRQRRDVDLGGRTGFVAWALRRGIPITPIASAGAHETFFIIRRGARFAHWTGVARHFHADAWPLAVGLPWGIWFAPMVPYLPLPSKITVEVQPPIYLREELSARFGRRIRAADADDPEVVRAGFERVLHAVRAGVSRLYDERKYPVLG